MFNHDSGNEGFKLSPGEKIELFVTYEIDKEGYEDATKESYSSASEKTREKLLGGKNNVIEVGNYTTFYTKEGIRFNTSAYKEGDISGQVDADSAPDNINFNKTVKDEDGDVTLDKKWFDDDADSAPVYRIYIREGDEERRIDGTVWEDKDSSDAEGFDTATADGIRQDSEPLIEGVTVSLVEKIRIPKDPESSGKRNLFYLRRNGVQQLGVGGNGAGDAENGKTHHHDADRASGGTGAGQLSGRDGIYRYPPRRQPGRHDRSAGTGGSHHAGDDPGFRDVRQQ